MSELTFVIEQLEATHDKKTFDCGVGALNNYLKTLAKQHQSKNISRTFVICENDTKKVSGFYTLATSSIICTELPDTLKHPHYPVAVIRLARLAVDMHQQGLGLGKQLLRDALSRSYSISRSVGVFGIVVDAKDNIAASFYEQFGFVMLENQPLTLFLPMKTIEQLFD